MGVLNDYANAAAVNAALNKGVEASKAVSELKEDLDGLETGSTVIKSCHYDETFTGNIAGNTYKSSTIEIPKNKIIEKIKFYAKNATPTTQGYLFILNESNVILDKIAITPSAAGWNEVPINKSYSEKSYVALSGGTVALTYSSTSKDNYYSNGLYEGANTERNKEIGDTISFSHNVEGRYYEFGFEIYLKVVGINEINSKVDSMSIDVNSLKNDSGIVMLNKIPIPKTSRLPEEGYSLFGRWYNFSDTYTQCVSSAGASVMMKAIGSTTLTVDLEQVVHPSHSDWRMETEPFIAYSIDGSEWTRVQIGTEAITISIPSTDEHFIWIVIDGLCLNSGPANRNSGWSAVNIKAITTDGKIYKVDSRSKHILFVGDSMVEGIDVLGTDSKSTSNSTVGEFAFKTARELNAMPLIQGYGGSTVWSGANYERYSVVDSRSKEFLVSNKVDLIVCEYGHNDYSLVNAGTKTEQEFIDGYNDLLNLLKNHYTGVPIIMIVPFAQRLKSAIATIANSKDYCFLVDTSNYDYQTLDGTHPSEESATNIAKSLASDIVQIMGKSYFM